ncbi:MAG: MATE family efflux transporter [Nanoarchaeota archaeon]|nr:MATE family efflux transporter [Nanoarchaeota archaeon]
MHETKNIIKGDLKKVILRLSWPMMISNLLQATYNITDTFWVGRLGSYAIAAVTISFPLVFVMIAIAMGIGVGGSILIAHAAGKAFKTKKEKDKKQINLIISQTFVLLFLAAVAVSFIGFLFTPKIVSLLSSEQAVFESAVVYMRTIFIGFSFMVLYYVFEAALRALGNTKTPMKFVLISVLINVILDPILIFGLGPFPKMGVFGAALATVISRAIISLIALYHLIKGTYGIRFELDFLKPKIKIIKDILKLGIPTTFEMGSIAIGSFMITYIVGALGTATLAAFGIVTRLFSFFMIPSLAISVSISTIVAQNFGAGNLKRAFISLKESAKLGFKIIIVISVFTFMFSRQIISAFTVDAEVIYLGTMFLRIISPFIILGFGRHVFIGFFRGIKRTDISMAVSIINHFILRIAGAYVLAFVFNLKAVGIWWSYPSMMFLSLIITYIIYLRIKKNIIKKKVDVEGIILKSEAESEIIE